MEACPKDAPVELSDGRIIRPDDTIMLKDLCEIVPLIMETIAGQSAQGGKGGVTPGAPVPISGRAPGAFSSPVANGFGGRPGSIPGMAPGQGGGGGGGGFGGGGGGRGPAGPPGPAGPQGPAGAPGTGSILGGQLKTSGSFTVAGAPQVIPNYFVNFNVSQQGNVTIRASANFNKTTPGEATLPDIKFGLQVDGTDYILADVFEQQGAGDDHVERWHQMIELFLENMAPGPHVVRGIYSGGSIGGDAMTFMAEPDLPAVLVVQGP